MDGGAGRNGDGAAGVVICDDNGAIRELLRAVIDNHPRLRVVSEAADGNEAILEATRLQPDVILLDLAMPSLSGLEAIPHLRRLAPNTQIVVYSGFAGAHVVDQVIALGATSYIEKGAHPDTIVATIEQALADTPCPAAGAHVGTAQSTERP